MLNTVLIFPFLWSSSQDLPFVHTTSTVLTRMTVTGLIWQNWKNVRKDHWNIVSGNSWKRNVIPGYLKYYGLVEIHSIKLIRLEPTSYTVQVNHLAKETHNIVSFSKEYTVLDSKG